ncbi:MAG TPA: hypothetical protein DDW31_05240 [candidate division Zixibacteria bacterium]|jgi:tetratricopeptide (TPR) repeat protein|nr:hypothetical protein [candidate division Zixibacteria bacterium]
MSGDRNEGLKRLKDDPRAAELIDNFERAAAGEERLEAGYLLAEHLASSGRNDQARQALEIAREYAKTERQQAAFLRREAELLFRESRFEEAAQTLERAIVMLGGTPEPMELFRTYRLQAMVYFRQGYLERARSFGDGAQAILSTVREGPGREETELAWAELHHLTALLDGASGNHDGAVLHYDREIDILEGLGRNDRLGSVYNNISGLLKTRGNLARALEYQLRSYQLASQGGDLLSVAISCNNLGEIYHGLGDLGHSLEYYKKYLELNKRISNRVGDAFGLAGLGRISMAQGDLAGAEGHFREALDVAREVKSLGREASLLAELCDLLCRQRRHQEAGNALDRAVAICLETQAFSTQRHQLLEARIKLSQAANAADRERSRLLAQARTMVEGALAGPIAIEDEEPVTERDLEREARLLLAEISRIEGRDDRAREEAGRAWAIVEKTLEMLPDKYRPQYLGKPEIRAVEALRKQLEGSN